MNQTRFQQNHSPEFKMKGLREAHIWSQLSSLEHSPTTNAPTQKETEWLKVFHKDLPY